jgi:hypothetical protein
VQKGTVKSPELEAALVDVYLGQKPPSRSMQHDFLNTVSCLMKE